MPRRLAICSRTILLPALLLVLPVAAFGNPAILAPTPESGAVQDEEQVPRETEEAAAPEPPPSPEPRQNVTVEAAAAALFDPALARQLQTAWDPVARTPNFTAGSNLTILSLPTGCNIYVASVESIQGAGAGGSDPTVEDVLFASGNYKGEAPLTLSLEPGDYVVGVRAHKRIYGFDGDCVRKVTQDVITGGQGKAYHLYMVRKKAGEYRCLLANFSDAKSTPEQLGEAVGLRDTFNLDRETLLSDLAKGSNVPEALRERVAEQLNRLGLAFYSAEGQDLLIKVFVNGAAFELREWPVE